MKNIILNLFLMFSIPLATAAEAIDFQFKASQNDLAYVSESFDDEILNIAGTEITRGDLRKYAGLNEGGEFSETSKYQTIIENRNFQLAVNASIVTAILHTALQAKPDKQKHAIVGALIGFGVTRICEYIFEVKNSFFCALTGTGATAITAVLKELRDSQGHGTVDAMDVIYTVFPGAIMSFSRPL